VSNDRWERPQHLRRAKRLSNGTVVVAEYESSGAIVRETYYYSGDDALLAKIVDVEPRQGEPPEAA
jgi:hypothetical protein